MKKDDEGGLILTEKYSLSQASGICGISKAEALVCGKSTTESLRSLFFQAGNLLRKSTLFDVRKKRALLLLRCPKVAFRLERGQLSTAAPSSPRFISHCERFGDDALSLWTKNEPERLERYYGGSIIETGR